MSPICISLTISSAAFILVIPLYLVYKVLTMIVTQILSPDDPVQVGLQQFLDDVDFLELLERFRFTDVKDRDQLWFSTDVSESLRSAMYQ
jgi:hypothetical protein